MKESLQFVLSGYYGCGNAGDEAVLAGIQESFARCTGEAAHPDTETIRSSEIVESFTRRPRETVRLAALSQNPLETAHRHGIRAVDRMNLSAMRALLHNSDLLISGGGSLLQDTTSIRSLLYYLWVVRLALSMKIPVMFYAQGIGPLRRSVSRALVRIVANRAAYITVRDAASARLLTSLGVVRPPIEVTADPAFALTPAGPAQVDRLMEAEGVPAGEPLLGVALRPWGSTSESYIEAYARLLTALERQCGARVVLLPMQIPGDIVFAETVAQHAGGPNAFPIVRHAYAPNVLLGLVGRLQAIVAMRLHALIFAARMGVPPFALSYDPKVESLMNGLGLADSMEHWRGFDPEEVAERVAALLAEREAQSAALNTQAAELERKALYNADCALGLFDRQTHGDRVIQFSV